MTGVIASLIGQGVSPEDSAVLGVYWHGLSADIAADRLSERALLARDIIETLPRAGRLIGDGISHKRYIEHATLDRLG